MEESMLVTGKSLFGCIHSNQLVANQKLMPDEINITMIPNQTGGQPGQYLKPSMLLSMAETSADKAAAAELMNFFITDPEANAILQIERGVSGDASVREELLGASRTPRRRSSTTSTSSRPRSARCRRRRRRTPASSTARCARPGTRSPSSRSSVEDGAKKYYDNAVAILARA